MREVIALISIWYQLIDHLLPFTWAGHLFMKNALLAVLLITPVFGLMGTMIVNNRMAFFSDAIGHSALTGIAIGVLLGIHNPLWAMVLFSILFSFAITYVKGVIKISSDTVIGVFSSTAIAAGIVILSRGGGFNKYSSYLIGDLLSIYPKELGLLLLLLAIVFVFWIAFFNKLLLVSVNPSLAASRGVQVRWIETLFTAMTAIVVSMSIQWVGLMIINSLLVLPAATARNLARNMRQYHVYSVGISLVSGVLGLLGSYYWNTATGATIVLVTAVGYFLSFLYRLRHSRL